MGGGEGRKGMGQAVWGLGEDLGFSWREGGAPEGCGQRMDQTWFRCSQCPLVAAGRTDCDRKGQERGGQG